MNLSLKAVLMLAVFLVATFSVAGVGGWITAPAVRDWYPSVVKPS